MWSNRIIGVGRQAFIALLLAWSATLMAGGVTPAVDLAEDMRRASGRALLVVFFFADSCPYCHLVEDLYLEPMQARGPYGGRVVIRKVDVERAVPMRDFAGRMTDSIAFARRQGAAFTPLLHFYGPDGRPIAEPLAGYTSDDFYGGQLESAIERALAGLPGTCAPALRRC